MTMRVELCILSPGLRVLTTAADDHVLLVYSAAPASRDAEALALLRVLGTEPLFEPAA